MAMVTLLAAFEILNCRNQPATRPSVKENHPQRHQAKDQEEHGQLAQADKDIVGIDGANTPTDADSPQKTIQRLGRNKIQEGHRQEGKNH